MKKDVIILLGQPIQNEDAAAAEAITPGMWITLNGSGLWIKHATGGGNAPLNVAMERDEMGKSVSVPYAIGDTVKAGALSSGMRFNALIPTGQNIAVGAQLESDGAGRFRILATGTPKVRALEAVNNATGSDARIRVEVI
jgi:hypothetical protein